MFAEKRCFVTKKEIKVVCVEPGKIAVAKSIGGDLKSLQREVGGYIEAFYPFDDPVALVCNDEGKLTGMPLNRAIEDESGEIYDVIAGNFLVVGLGEEDFDSLSDELVEKYVDKFKHPESFVFDESHRLIRFKLTDMGDENAKRGKV